MRRSQLEQRLRALGSLASNDFQRPVTAEHAQAMVSSGECEEAALGWCFRMPSNPKTLGVGVGIVRGKGTTELHSHIAK